MLQQQPAAPPAAFPASPTVRPAVLALQSTRCPPPSGSTEAGLYVPGIGAGVPLPLLLCDENGGGLRRLLLASLG